MASGHHLTVAYTIKDELSYKEFIVVLRSILADHPDREDIFDRHDSSLRYSSREHPVLAKQRAEQPARWIHVKLQVVEGEETFWTTLVIRDDNLYVCGFINQKGVVYELIENTNISADMLPVDEYNPRRLCWGVHYRSLLDADTKQDLPTRLARHVRMGRSFAMRAVRVLSGFPGWADGDMNPRVALGMLMFMVCESARMNHVNEFITRLWLDKKRFEYNELHKYLFNYRRTSYKLLTWKSEGYHSACPMSELRDIYLVLNYRLNLARFRLMDLARPRVELLAMRADLAVDGTRVIVFDGKRGYIIYMKEKQEDKQEEKGTMVDLVLTGPYTSILAHGCFAIKIDVPPGTAPGSSKGRAGGSIKWEWDRYDPKYAEEVDNPPVTRTISSSGPGRNVEVTYAVMSNALEATVQVKLWINDPNSSSVHGKITARIGDFHHQIILFKLTQGTAQHFSPTHHLNVLRLARSLELVRNVVAVPCDQKLDIEMHLIIETSKNPGVSNNTYLDDTLSFNNGIWSQHRKVDDVVEVEVTVAWFPDSFNHSSGQIQPMEICRLLSDHTTYDVQQIEMSRRLPDLSYTIGNDAEGFSTFILELRRLVAEHPRCKDLMADYPQDSTHDHPVLPRGRITRETNKSPAHMKPEMLLHIKLEAVDGVETSSITLIMRDDNLDVIGFISKEGYCYELRGDTELPSEYRSETLRSWSQGGLLLEESTTLGKTFAANAVQVLSRFENMTHPKYREALQVLMVMIGDSARIEPIGKAIAEDWDSGMKLTQELKDYRKNWDGISRALLDWRDHTYERWPQNSELESIGIMNEEDALKVVSLVFNDQERIWRHN